MTTLDTTMAVEVVSLLAEFGKDVVFTSAAVVAEYDPATGRTTQSSPTTYTVKSAPPFAYEQRYVNGNTVQEGDLRLLIAGADQEFTPKVGQKVTFDSGTYRVVSVIPYYSGEDIAAWEVQVRQ